jgi:hypothetical protein
MRSGACIARKDHILNEFPLEDDAQEHRSLVSKSVTNATMTAEVGALLMAARSTLPNRIFDRRFTAILNAQRVG